jgi:topoisomerase IV subunit B
MVGAVAIRLKDPVFESQTKNKLGNTEIRATWWPGRDVVADLLHRNPAAAERLLPRSRTPTQKLRKELQTVKKMARERAKASRSASPAQGLQEHLRPQARQGATTR